LLFVFTGENEFDIKLPKTVKGISPQILLHFSHNLRHFMKKYGSYIFYAVVAIALIIIAVLLFQKSVKDTTETPAATQAPN